MTDVVALVVAFYCLGVAALMVSGYDFETGKAVEYWPLGALGWPFLALLSISLGIGLVVLKAADFVLFGRRSRARR